MADDKAPPELDADGRSQLLTVLTTEHTSAQNARSAGVAEANGRTTSFFAALSGALVALALVAQIASVQGVLVPIALVLAWTVLYIGVLTFVRLVEIAAMDALLVVAINRIRHHYFELVPGAERSAVLSAYDDLAGIAEESGRSGTAIDVLAAAPGMVAGIDGILAGVMAGLVAAQLGAAVPVAVAVGVVAGLITDAALFAYGLHARKMFWLAHPPRYPTPQR